MTFGQAADLFLRDFKRTLSNQKHARQWHSTLQTYAASLMQMPVADILTPRKTVSVRTPPTKR